MSGWDAVAAPVPVTGSAPEAGRLEPGLQQLAAWQGAWPPHRPVSPATVVLEATGSADAAGSLDDGRRRADALVDSGADLLVVQGSGDVLEGLVVAAALLGLEPVKAVGTSPGPGWVEQTVAVRDGLRVSRVHRADPAAVLGVLSATAVAVGAGLLAQAASRRTAVLLDGSTAVAAAALCAARLAPGAASWFLLGSSAAVPAAAEAHRELGLTPLLDLRLPGAAGAAIGLTVLQQACDLAARG